MSKFAFFLIAESNQASPQPQYLETSSLAGNVNATTNQPPRSSQAVTDCVSYIRKQVNSAEIFHGLPLNNEYELIPFNHFTFSRVYPIELGLGKRVVEKPIGYKRKDLLDALNKAMESLNKNTTTTTTTGKFTLDDFIEGVYRNDPTTGTQYEMYFRNKEANKSTHHIQSSSLHHEHSNHGVSKVLVMRPFAPMQTVQIEVYAKSKEKELIHIILPLSGRTSTFQSFMDKFVKIALKNDRRVHLTVVYFGEEGLFEARSIMSRVLSMKNSGGNSSNLKLLALNETFSRGKLTIQQGRPIHAVGAEHNLCILCVCISFSFHAAKGLRVGAERVWDKSDKKKDVLLFMCDVDIVFSAKFLERCRWNAKPGKKVISVMH